MLKRRRIIIDDDDDDYEKKKENTIIIKAKKIQYGYVSKSSFIILYKKQLISFFAYFDKYSKYTLTSVPFNLSKNKEQTKTCFKISFDLNDNTSHIMSLMPNEVGCDAHIPASVYMSFADYINRKFKIKECFLEDAAKVHIDKKIKPLMNGGDGYVPLSLITLLIHQKPFYEYKYNFRPLDSDQNDINNFLIKIKTINFKNESISIFDSLRSEIINLDLKSNFEKLELAYKLTNVWSEFYNDDEIFMSKKYYY